MSAFKGTPGPWHYIGTTLGEDSGWFVRVAPHRHVSAEGRNGKEAEANARLIAAAPELLEVAQRSADALRSAGIEPRATSDNPLEWLLHQTEAAIAKATGEQP